MSKERISNMLNSLLFELTEACQRLFREILFCVCLCVCVHECLHVCRHAYMCKCMCISLCACGDQRPALVIVSQTVSISGLELTKQTRLAIQ